MPGSGLRSANVIDVAKITGAKEFHTSASIFTDSKMNFIADTMEEDLKSVIVDGEEVKRISALLENYQPG
jgi:copper homeostasis protein CutC